MTNTEIIQAIKAEIDRLHLESVMAAIGNQTDWLRSRVATCVDILSFLSTLESEKPVPADLEEAAKKYATEWHKNPDGSAWKPYFEVSAIKAFIAGAKWDRENMMKEAVEGEVKHVATVHYVKTNESQLTARLKQFQDGDKVKIIIVKEDEQ